MPTPTAWERRRCVSLGALEAGDTPNAGRTQASVPALAGGLPTNPGSQAAWEGRGVPSRHPPPLEGAVSRAGLSDVCSWTPRAIAQQPLVDGEPGGWAKAGNAARAGCGLCVASGLEEPCPRCPSACAPVWRMEGVARLHRGL